MKKHFFLFLITLIPALTLAQSVRIGDLLCVHGNDTTFVHPENYTDGAIGVVFYVDESGEHGWVLQPEITAENIYWSYLDELPWGLTGWNSVRESLYDLDGYSNTEFLRAASPIDHNMYPGAWVVDFEHGWYWPAIGQLNILYANALIVNQSLQMIGGDALFGRWHYWSSSAFGFDNDCALYLGYHGGIGAIQKSRTDISPIPLRIRSARNF